MGHLRPATEGCRLTQALTGLKPSWSTCQRSFVSRTACNSYFQFGAKVGRDVYLGHTLQ